MLHFVYMCQEEEAHQILDSPSLQRFLRQALQSVLHRSLFARVHFLVLEAMASQGAKFFYKAGKIFQTNAHSLNKVE